MAKLTIEEILAAIKELTVIELNDLVKMSEEEFGVSAAAGMVMGGPVAGAVAETAEEKTEFDVELTEAAADVKIKVIKAVKEITGLSLVESKTLVDGAPKMVKEGVSKDDAAAMKAKIEEAGGKVTIK